MSLRKHIHGYPIIKYGNATAKLVIGNYCSFADNVTIYLGGHYRKNIVSTYPFENMYKNVCNYYQDVGNLYTKGNVVIGNDVSIGDNVTIMSGVTIGDGAIISNNSHVIKDIKPYSLVGGNPAKLIRYRFTPNQIDKLLKIQWWNWEEYKIDTYAHLLCKSNIDDFIKSVE